MNVYRPLGLARALSTTRRQALQTMMKTITNPTEYQMQRPAGFSPKAVLIFGTPAYLPQITKDAIKLYEDNIQVVVAGVDTVGPFSSRQGVSELWLDETMHINGSKLLEEETTEKLRESDGINIVIAQERNWKRFASKLTLGLSEKHTVSMSLANSLFNTNHQVTLFYLQPVELDEQQNSGHTLSELSATLPEGVVANSDPLKSDRWTPLFDYDSHEPMIITHSVGNLIKKINKKSAAKILETNDRLMSLASKETQVYVKVFTKNSSQPMRYQVIAGGGGWGAKADTIVVSPSAKIRPGDRIEFYMLTPNDRFAKESPFGIDNKVVFECSLEETSYGAGVGAQATSTVFGCGMESGIVHNDVEYASGGERLIFDPCT